VEVDRFSIGADKFYGLTEPQNIYEGLNILMDEAKKENKKAVSALCKIYYDN